MVFFEGSSLGCTRHLPSRSGREAAGPGCESAAEPPTPSSQPAFYQTHSIPRLIFRETTDWLTDSQNYYITYKIWLQIPFKGLYQKRWQRRWEICQDCSIRKHKVKPLHKNDFCPDFGKHDKIQLTIRACPQRDAMFPQIESRLPANPRIVAIRGQEGHSATWDLFCSALSLSFKLS